MFMYVPHVSFVVVVIVEVGHGLVSPLVVTPDFVLRDQFW